MRKYKQRVEFANFICHFGNAELLDYLDEIVVPALLENTLVRHWGESKYFLHQTAIGNINLGRRNNNVIEPAIYGRFVLDTKLHRDQIFSEDRLIERPGQFQSAPSSQFVLLLNSHKLLFAKEMAGAPGLTAFRTTVELLLKNKRLAYVNMLYEGAKNRTEGESRITKKSIQESIPAPDLKIVPLSGESTIQNFVNSFKILREVRIEVVKPNAEINNEKFFSHLEKTRNDLRADKSTVLHKSNRGLDKTAALAHIIPAADGNTEVNLSGIGQNDQTLKGNNEDFKASHPVELQQNNLRESARLMLQSFVDSVRSGILRVANAVPNEVNSSKVKRLIDES